MKSSNPYQSPPRLLNGDDRDGKKWLLTALALETLQLIQFLIQRVELAIYDSQIEAYMPTMEDPDRTHWVASQFYWLVIRLPMISQVFLLPLVIFAAAGSSISRRHQWVICLASVLTAILIWYNAFIAITYLVGTFD